MSSDFLAGTAALLGFVAALSGVAGSAVALRAWVVVSRENKAKDEAATKVQTDLATAKTKQAEAELILLNLQRSMREPRHVDVGKANELLHATLKGSVEIHHVEGVEPQRLSHELEKILSENGWTVTVKQVSSESVGYAGISLLTGSKNLAALEIGLLGRPVFFEEPGRTLEEFSDTCVVGNVTGYRRHDPSLEPTKSILLIGPKFW